MFSKSNSRVKRCRLVKGESGQQLKLGIRDLEARRYRLRRSRSLELIKALACRLESKRERRRCIEKAIAVQVSSSH